MIPRTPAAMIDSSVHPALAEGPVTTTYSLLPQHVTAASFAGCDSGEVLLTEPSS
jgi:hypothetical protein